MANFQSIQISVHASKRFSERNIQASDVTAAVSNPDKRTRQRMGANGGISYLYFKKCESGGLYVVAEVKAGEAFIVTAWWES